MMRYSMGARNQGGRKHTLKIVTEIYYITAERSNMIVEGDGDREAGMGEILQVLVGHAHNTGLHPFSTFPCYPLRLFS